MSNVAAITNWFTVTASVKDDVTPAAGGKTEGTKDPPVEGSTKEGKTA